MQNLDRVVRSLFRYSLMSDGTYPEILVQTEEKILVKAFAALTPAEVLYLKQNWADLKKKRTAEYEAENKRLDADFEKFLAKIH